jgi:hypothetical protein
MTGIKLEAGKRAIARNGQIFGPLVNGPNGTFECPRTARSWFANGQHTLLGPSPLDLIALAPDEAPEPDELATIRAENARLREALEKIAKNSTDETNPNLSSQDSFGNADDVFYDGMRQGDYYTAEIARTALTAKEPAQ